MLGIGAILFLYGLIAFAGFRIAQRARDSYSQLLAARITALILSQAVLNVFAVLGLAPLTGVPLPFISYGSTNLIVLLIGMGVLLNVAAGGNVKLRAVPEPDVAGSRRNGSKPRSTDHPHRGGRHGGARRAGAGGRRRAAS